MIKKDLHHGYMVPQIKKCVNQIQNIVQDLKECKMDQEEIHSHNTIRALLL